MICNNELSPFQDDALANTKSMGIQYKELEEEKGRVERRLEQLQKSLGDVEEGMSLLVTLQPPPPPLTVLFSADQFIFKFSN